MRHQRRRIYRNIQIAVKALLYIGIVICGFNLFSMMCLPVRKVNLGRLSKFNSQFSVQRWEGDTTTSKLEDCLVHWQNKINSHHQRWHLSNLPILVSVLGARPGFVDGVFNTKHIHSAYEDWSNAEWFCISENGMIRSENINKDPHQHTLVVSCQVDGSNLSHFKVKGQMYSIEGHCLGLNNLPKVNLAACTMVKGQPRALLPQWIEYHKLLGFERFYIYANEDAAKIKDYLQLLDGNIPEYVQIIPFWYSIDEPFFYQQAMQNDCIYRLRNSAKWSALHDVDEFFQLMNNKKDLLTMLDSYERPLGGVQVFNQFFGRDKRIPIDANSSNSTILFEKYTYRAPHVVRKGRQKVIGYLANITYFSVHMITLGSRMVVADPESELRMNHFRRPQLGVFGYYRQSAVSKTIEDTTLSKQYAHIVQRALEKYQLRGDPV